MRDWRLQRQQVVGFDCVICGGGAGEGEWEGEGEGEGMLRVEMGEMAPDIRG